MLAKTKGYFLKNITRFPRPIANYILSVNRKPEMVFGKNYRKYREFLHSNYAFYNNQQKLIDSVNNAIQTIPFYHERYGNHKISSVDEFEQTISFIDKDIILDNYHSFVNPDVSNADYDTGTTGGTSGKPLTFIAPKNRYVVELATMHSLWEQAGYQFDVRAVIRNHRLPKKKDYLINPLTREVIFDGFRLNDEYFEHIGRIISKMRIRFVHCYPSTAYEFALYLKKRGGNYLNITAFLSGSENIFDYQRDLIEKDLGIRFYNWYGHSEKLILAGYCEHTNLYHAEPTYGYFELIDENGEVIRKSGGFGEIVGTSFHNSGMPFIRYRTGDYAEYVGDECTVCGRRLPVFKNVKGRWSGDRIYNADGSFVTTTALNLHNDLYQVINGIQYLQKKKGELIVLIVKSLQYTDAHEKKIYEHFAGKLHDDSKILIKYVDKLIRKPNGKFVHIISEIEQDNERLMS